MLRSSETLQAVERPIPKMYVSATSSRFSRGRLTPAILAIFYPCLCLWRGFVQMTMVRPFRRITRHRSHIGLTDARTFISPSRTRARLKSGTEQQGALLSAVAWTHGYAQPGCAVRNYGSKRAPARLLAVVSTLGPSSVTATV